MVRVRYTGGSLYSRRDGPTWTPDDPVHDVNEDLAEALTRRARFEYADSADSETESETEPDDDAESESEPDICQHVLTSGDREGEVCGRDLPCPYHDDAEG